MNAIEFKVGPYPYRYNMRERDVRFNSVPVEVEVKVKVTQSRPSPETYLSLYRHSSGAMISEQCSATDLTMLHFDSIRAVLPLF